MRGKKGGKNKNKNKNKKQKTKTRQNNIVIIIIIFIIIPIPKSTTNIYIHHFNTTFMSSWSIVGVPFDSVGILRTTLILRTTCVPAVIGVLAVWRYNKPKNQKQFPNTFGGGDFEIVPTYKISPLRRLFRFPPRARGCFRGKQTQLGKSEATRPIPWYQDRAGCSPLPKAPSVSSAVTPLPSPWSACIAFRDWRASAKPVRARGGKGRAPPEVRHSSRRIFALYTVRRGSTGRFNPRLQVPTLSWIPDLSPNKTRFFEKTAGQRTN